MNRARKTMDDAMTRIRQEVTFQRAKSNSMCRLSTAHNWSDEREQVDSSFFWRAHTITVLVFLVCCLVYVAVFEDYSETPSDFNYRRGMLAALLAWVTLGMTIMPDGPFMRPHPALWRLSFAVSIAYELLLIFVLFQSLSDVRNLLKHLDAQLGKPINELSYGGNCRLYDYESSNPFHNIWDKVDIFIPAHLFGYWCKTLIFRDWWVPTVLSVLFEFLEYSLEHQLPNFSECWWDHWIMDVVLCNGGGTILGMVTLRHLSMKTYNWRGLWDIPTYRGKMRRIFSQFSPHAWIAFTWQPLSSLERWLAMMGIIGMFLLSELTTFYIKFILWFHPEHWLNFVRLGFLLLWGAVCLRETFQLIDDPECDRLGRQSWVLILIIATEFLICLKFGWNTIIKPIPAKIVIWWVVGIIFLIIYTLVKFCLFQPSILPEPYDSTIDVERKKK